MYLNNNIHLQNKYDIFKYLLFTNIFQIRVSITY